MKTPEWEAAKFKILLRDGFTREVVYGFVMRGGNFGIYFDADHTHKYVVTHLPSGMKMPNAGFPTTVAASKYCELVSDMSHDWSLPSIKLDAAGVMYLREAMPRAIRIAREADAPTGQLD